MTDTQGCNLNCEYVFHTVGPNVTDDNKIDQYKKELKNCYKNCLSSISKPVKSIAFPCISTGIYKFDNKEVAKIAIETVRSWLESNHSFVENIVKMKILKFTKK